MSHLPAASNDPHPTPTVEDYLMNMYVMERDHGEIVAARLAELLSVAPATVAMTLKRMQRDNWITDKSRARGIHLTDTGRAAADSVIRRHMLTEWLLVKILKVPYLQIHAEAHHIEHAISPQIEERLNEILDAPRVCPHGNPFPGCEEVTRLWIPLNEIIPGEPVIIRRIHEFAENNQDLLEFLIDNGVLPGAQAKVMEVLPFNQTLTITVADKPVTLGFPVARYIFVERRA
jgi:DtxR family Mn-dependent transcriptional regulator